MTIDIATVASGVITALSIYLIKKILELEKQLVRLDEQVRQLEKLISKLINGEP